LKKKFSDEIINKIETEIRNKVLERENKYKENLKLTQSKEVTVDSLSAVSELSNVEINDISNKVFEKYGFPYIKELQKVNKQITLLKHYRELIDLFILKIPHFKDYTEQADMQNADRIIRDFLYEHLLDFKKQFLTIMKRAQKDNKLELLPELDSLSLQIEKLAKKCNYADYISVNNTSAEEDSEHYRLLDYNWKLISILDGIKLIFSNVSISADWIDLIRKKIITFEDLLKKRKSIITEK